ncbi:hypothetical protein EYF80_055145 [Liparis tanakae]|uniref:Uncharacterized protein n=1 Tax=Liparis tanakae TaxID=230148 RepID=A0A4Z2F1Y1_9TELE|nr:hypothetical protein EYF80_055145 [Liparis tanakae]
MATRWSSSGSGYHSDWTTSGMMTPTSAHAYDSASGSRGSGLNARGPCRPVEAGRTTTTNSSGWRHTLLTCGFIPEGEQKNRRAGGLKERNQLGL